VRVLSFVVVIEHAELFRILVSQSHVEADTNSLVLGDDARGRAGAAAAARVAPTGRGNDGFLLLRRKLLMVVGASGAAGGRAHVHLVAVLGLTGVVFGPGHDHGPAVQPRVVVSFVGGVLVDGLVPARLLGVCLAPCCAELLLVLGG